MNGMKKLLALLLACTALAACQDDLGLQQPGTPAEGVVDIYLSGAAMPGIVTRADGGESVDYRVDNVILFAFDANGNLVNHPVQQSVTPDNSTQHRYKFRSYLPDSRAVLYAVCNHDDPATLIERVQHPDATTATTAEAALKQEQLQIAAVEDAFKGVYVMEGSLPKAKEGTPIVIPVTRVVSRHHFVISFQPDNWGDVQNRDQFKLSSVQLVNIPTRTWLLADAASPQPYNFGAENDLAAGRYTNWTGDAVYIAPDAADKEALAEAYYIGKDIPLTEEDKTGIVEVDAQKGSSAEGFDTYDVTFHLFENRRGALTADQAHAALDITGYPADEQARIRQMFKRDLANHTGEYKNYADDPGHPYASCLVIEGMYEDNANGGLNSEVRYYIYLGHDNYGDFNVQRNHDYTYHVTIRACDEIDTRVSAEEVGDIKLTVSKSQQAFDAHFNVREALVNSTRPWKAYVKDPDRTPWLELSKSSVYRRQALGEASDPACARFTLTGNAGLEYIYIHTDEYVPEAELNGKNQYGHDEYDIAGTNQTPPRTGQIVYIYQKPDGEWQSEKDAEEKGQVFTVVQYPAQLVKVDEPYGWDVSGATTRTYPRYFFVERITEEKYKSWGFLQYWSMELDYLISQGVYDGLECTRRAYVSAYWGDNKSQSLEARQAFDPLPEGFEYASTEGYENAAYWPDADEGQDDFQPETTGAAAIANLIPNSTALGYALRKNRDRDGNQRVDYNEILWYLPARKQLEAIQKAMQELKGPNTGTDADSDGIPDETAPLSLDGNYWSSTPSVSDKYGITPGRAYYYDMSGGKSAIGLRNQSLNVIVCRDLNGWTGPETGNGQGGVNVDTDWDEDEEHNTPRGDSK